MIDIDQIKRLLAQVRVLTQPEAVAAFDELNALGWRDSKIEMVLLITQGYISQVRVGNLKSMGWEKSALILNFLEQERAKVSHETLTFGKLPCDKTSQHRGDEIDA